MIAIIIVIGLGAAACILPTAAGYVGYRWGLADGRLAESTRRKQEHVDAARAARAELADNARREAEAAAARPPGHGNYPHLLRHGTAASFTPRMAPAGRHHSAPVTPPPDDDTITGMPPVPAAPPAAAPDRGEHPYSPLRPVPGLTPGW